MAERICAGLYRVRGKEAKHSATITFFSYAEGASFNGWVIQSDWDINRMSDPYDTKREALVAAMWMVGHPYYYNNDFHAEPRVA